MIQEICCTGPTIYYVVTIKIVTIQVLSNEEYRSWLRVQEAAETSLDDRDKMLYNAACEIETNLELLGMCVSNYQGFLRE